MKLFKCIVLLITVLFASCQKDPLINCNCNLPFKDMLCKTYLFENDKCIGYIDYGYNVNLQKETENFKTIKGKVEKTISYAYNSQGFISEENIKTFSPDKIEKIAYSFNTANQIEKIEQYENEALKESKLFFYDDNKSLKQTKTYSSGVLDSLILFEYDTEGKLWRKSCYNSDSVQTSYEIYKFYTNGIECVKLYDANDAYLGYNLWVHNSDGYILSFAAYNSTNDLIEKTIYNYENMLLIKESTQDGFGKLISYIVHFYS